MRISASVLILICSLVLGFAGWMATLGTWGDALRPVTLAGLLGSFAGVVLAWLGKSPLNSKKNGNGDDITRQLIAAAEQVQLKQIIQKATSEEPPK